MSPRFCGRAGQAGLASLEPQGSHFQVQAGCGQNSVLCCCRGEIPVSMLVVSQGHPQLLEATLDPAGGPSIANASSIALSFPCLDGRLSDPTLLQLETARCLQKPPVLV